MRLLLPVLAPARWRCSSEAFDGEPREVSAFVQAWRECSSEESQRSPDAWRYPAVRAVPCYRPIRAFKGRDGVATLARRQGWSDRAFAVACGQCIGCRLARAQSWAIRAVHESMMHSSSVFLTLTYDQAHVPDDGSVDVRTWQLFAKKVRKELGPFRFLHCGEYGGRSYRPHYHALLFGVEFPDALCVETASDGSRLYWSDQVARLWRKGQHRLGAVTMQSAAYVARYVTAKASRNARTWDGVAYYEERYRRVDDETGEEFYVRPEYSTMSRRPGLGATWFEKYWRDVFPHDQVVLEGRSYAVPDYYSRKFQARDPEAFLEIQAERRARARARGAASGIGSFIDGEGDLAPARLADREQIAEAFFSSRSACL